MPTSADSKNKCVANAVQLHTKLYGSKEELDKTATSILQTGLSVQRRSRRRSGLGVNHQSYLLTMVRPG